MQPARSLREPWHELSAAHRRWILVNAIVVPAVVNVVLNGAIAWLMARGARTVPLWPASLVGRPSVFTDTLGTLFMLPFMTCLFCTTAVWRELQKGTFSVLGPAAAVLALDRLPARRLRRGLVLGSICFALFAPTATALMAVARVEDVSLGAFVVYKALVGLALGAIVTPLIALRAMADRPA